jgi:hypothetical protein
MMTRDEAYNLICDLNEEAHSATYNEWEEAGDDEGLLEDASYSQAEEFTRLFDLLEEDKKSAILHWAENDEDFAEEFNSWRIEE